MAPIVDRTRLASTSGVHPEARQAATAACQIIHIEKTQWSPNCKSHLIMPETTNANLCRNPVPDLEAVDTFPPAYLPCRPFQYLYCVLAVTTVSNVSRIPMA